MAINWGEAVNAAWLVVAGVCVYFNASPRRFAASTTAHAVGFLNLSLHGGWDRILGADLNCSESR
jgi:hypothetical protein